MWLPTLLLLGQTYSENVAITVYRSDCINCEQAMQTVAVIYDAASGERQVPRLYVDLLRNGRRMVLEVDLDGQVAHYRELYDDTIIFESVDQRATVTPVLPPAHSPFEVQLSATDLEATPIGRLITVKVGRPPEPTQVRPSPAPVYVDNGCDSSEPDEPEYDSSGCEGDSDDSSEYDSSGCEGDSDDSGEDDEGDTEDDSMTQGEAGEGCEGDSAQYTVVKPPRNAGWWRLWPIAAVALFNRVGAVRARGESRS